ncbi:hypothetical protein EV663_1412, partial [Rhodovulum bhavnagarense]
MPIKKTLRVTKRFGISVPAAPWEIAQSEQPKAKSVLRHTEQQRTRDAPRADVREIFIHGPSTKEINAAIDISNCDLGAFSAAISHGASGDQIIYHIGKKCDGKHKKEASVAAQQGLVLLTSKRLADGNFEYIATIAKKFGEAPSNERKFLFGRYLYECASSLGELQRDSLSTIPNFRFYLHEYNLCITDQVCQEACSWIQHERGKCETIRFFELMQRFGISSKKYSSERALNEFEAKLNLIGIFVAPHSSLMRPQEQSDVIAFTIAPQLTPLSGRSRELIDALVAVVLAASILHKSDCLTEHNKKSIAETITASFDLKEHERFHILENLAWFFLHPPKNLVLLSVIKNASRENTPAFRKIVAACAGKISGVDRRLLGHLEEIYNMLWLPPALAYSDLHAGKVADGPRTVRDSQPGRPGEAIPELEKASGPKLDASRIAAIRSDTERVSSVLGQIFDVEEEESGASGTASQSQLAGLDPKHGALV